MFRGKIQALKVRFLGLACLCLLAASCAAASAQNESNPQARASESKASRVYFTDIVVSPDGNQIAFEYGNTSAGRGVIGLGLYQPKTGKLSRVPAPAGKQFSMPSFSPDGQRLLVVEGSRGAVRGNQIAEIDLRTMQAKEITAPAQSPIFYPVYQPGTGKILYWNDYMRLSHGLFLLDPSVSKQQKVFSENERFGYVRRPFFIGANTLIFQGRGRAGLGGAADVQATGNVSGALAYRMDLGGTPQLLSAEAERNKPALNSAAFDGLSVSRDGHVITYVCANAPKYLEDKTPDELCQSSNGRTTQLTNLGQKIFDTYMAANGAIIAFESYIPALRTYDIYVYDAQTRAATPTNLYQHISSNPAFTLGAVVD